MNTTANKITLFRIALIPVFLGFLYCMHPYIAFSVYIIACISDMADGYVARRYNQISDFGKFVDPLADKMLVLSAMCVFVEKGTMEGWVLAIVLCREFAVSGLRLIAAGKQYVIAASVSGKIKTAATMVCIGVMLLFGQHLLLDRICCAIIVFVTVYSGIDYFAANKDVFKA